MKRCNLPKYVSCFKDRHGKPRYRFRRKGYADYYIIALLHSAAFQREYEACISGTNSPRLKPGHNSLKAGTVADLIHRYFHSPNFVGLAISTKNTYRNQLMKFAESYGDNPVHQIKRKHISAIIGGMADRPGAANSLLARLKLLLSFAVDIEMIPINPIEKLKGIKTKSKGFHSWSDAEIAAFLKTHKSGSRERLAFSLLLYTGQRRSDVVKMGWQDTGKGTILVAQQKTDERLELPILAALAEELTILPLDAPAFILTSQGKPFSSAGFGNWFREVCDKANLPHCSAHGLRKAAARRLAEAGCTNQQIKAVTGHRTEAEVARYTRAASQKTLAEHAYEMLSNNSKSLENV